MNYLEQIKEAATFISGKSKVKPKIGLILGSGLGSLADEIKPCDKIPYSSIPHFATPSVSGHAGQWVTGMLRGKPVAAMQGRFHFYEGFAMKEITFPVRVMRELGITTLIVTNACGSLNPSFYPGALMFIKDHINLMGDNPLMGENYEELGPRFPDMSQAYDKGLIKMGKEVSNKLGIETFTGVHSAISGPYYLSSAELTLVSRVGADTVGMSTIPETIAAIHGGMKVLGISCITDMAIPNQLEPLDHAHVVEVANKTRPKFIKLVSGIIDAIKL